MNKPLLAYLLPAIALLAAPVLAGSQINIRLIEATDSGTGNPAGLADVIGVLKRSLVYKNYSLVAQASLPLPAANRVVTLGSYSVSCSGQQGSLAISVRRGGRVMLNTNISLRDNRPLIVGGFPSGRGKRVLVFVAR